MWKAKSLLKCIEAIELTVNPWDSSSNKRISCSWNQVRWDCYEATGLSITNICLIERLYHHGEPLQTTALVSFRSLISVLSAKLARTSVMLTIVEVRSTSFWECLENKSSSTSKTSIRATMLAVNLSYPVVTFGCEQDSLSAVRRMFTGTLIMAWPLKTDKTIHNPFRKNHRLTVN